MESEKKKICPKCKHEDGSGQNNIYDMNPGHFANVLYDLLWNEMGFAIIVHFG